MAEGQERVPSLALQSTKRVVDTLTIEDCAEIYVYANKRIQSLAGVALRDALHAMEHLAPFTDVIDTMSIMEGENTFSLHTMISFEFDNEVYHLAPGGTITTVAKCTDAPCEHTPEDQFPDNTIVQRTETAHATKVGNVDRPLNVAQLGRFIGWLEALTANKDAFDALQRYTYNKFLVY
jgi:hypothetical protein